jgi:DMSO/TMAO reductase YedYZ molybdopterin-dependent catalytic subunit
MIEEDTKMEKSEKEVTLKKNWNMLVVISCFIIVCFPVMSYSLEPAPITPIDEFFVLHDSPNIPDDWHLTVDGEVSQPLSLTLDDLARYTAITQMSTLECYFPTGPKWLVGNANWTGVPLNTIIQEAAPLDEAVSITFHAIDNYSQGPFSLNEIQQRNDFLLAYGMNDQTLPLEQGYPLKLVLPGIGGFQNVRWLDYIEITASTPTGKLYHYPIHARIFEPEYRETIAIGTYIIHGMAFAGEGIEITNVEVSIDDGETWQAAELLNFFVPNVWKHWQFIWDIPQVGEYKIFARSQDSLSNVQNEIGDFGWRGFVVSVTVDYDNDSDAIPNSRDNCIGVYNPSQTDSDTDGIGNACDEDCPNLDGLNPVDFVDFSILAYSWQISDTNLPGDLTFDHIVDFNDLRIFSLYWLSDCFEQ